MLLKLHRILPGCSHQARYPGNPDFPGLYIRDPGDFINYFFLFALQGYFFTGFVV